MVVEGPRGIIYATRLVDLATGNDVSLEKVVEAASGGSDVTESTATSRGSSVSQEIQDWLTHLRFTEDFSFTPKDVMDTPPTATITKGTGVSAVTVTNGGSGYVFGDIITLEGDGVFAEAAQVRVLTVGTNGAITAVQIKVPGVYTTTPTAPVTGTGGTGSDATFTPTFNASVASSIYGGTTWSRTNTSCFDYLGSNIGDVSSGWRGQTSGNGTQCVISFCSDAPKLDIRLVGLNSNYDLYVDGERIADAPITTDSTGSPYTYTIDWSDVAKVRTYTLKGINTAFGGVITASTYSVWTPTRWRPTVWQLGDSYTYGTQATQQSFNDFGMLSGMLGFDGIADGIGGAGWTSTSSTKPQTRITSKLATLSRVPEFVFLSMGYNDAGGDMDTLSTNFTESVALIQEYCPLAKIVVMGPATPLGTTTNISTVRTTVMGLCDTLGLSFIDVQGWITSANTSIYTSTDSTHPNDDGYAFRAARFAQALLDII